MRRLPGSSIAFVLAMLLFATTPVGTGAGPHQLELVHPLFSHQHIIGGRVVTHEQIAGGLTMSASSEPGTARGPAFGAGSGGAPAAGGFGLSPIPPTQSIAALLLDLGRAWLSTELSAPPGREEAPPDPPPLLT
jgi:hypothetical protein